MKNTVPIDNHGLRQVLVIDDEENMRHMLVSLLAKADFAVDTACDGAEGLEMIGRRKYDFILCDIKMPRLGGLEFLSSAQSKLQGTTVIMMSAYGTIDTAMEAIGLGAYDYISKPFKTDEVLLTLKKAEERERLRRENRLLKQRIRKIEANYQFGNMIGKSKSIEALFKVARKASGYDTTVLISGESGTGKELIAKGIHFSGNRASMPIVCLNCAGIPENLLESELFGYTKGSFTGADRNKKGLFEEAQGGTIFLDEIGDMPLSLQAKLLRVLQEKEVRPIGAAETKNLDVRVIAATAQNLEEKVKQRTFREDLFYRLNVLAVQVPPLRERREDIPLLCRHFVSRFNAKLGRKIRGISRPAMRQLIEHSWPGNVRQLENAIERAVVLSDKDIIDVDILPAELGAHAIEDGPDACFKQQSLKVAQRMLEEKLIRKALQTSHGNRSQAARLLEISHPSLLSKMKRYQINA